MRSNDKKSFAFSLPPPSHIYYIHIVYTYCIYIVLHTLHSLAPHCSPYIYNTITITQYK